MSKSLFASTICRTNFRREVLAEAWHIPPRTPDAELRIFHRDSGTSDIVTIDGETARDFDDAVWVDRLPNGNFALQVHIADVSHMCARDSNRPRGSLQRHQRYFPDRAVSMCRWSFPPTLFASAQRGPPRPLRFLEIDHRGAIAAQEFCSGMIRSAERMTYTNVFGVLEGDACAPRTLQPSG